MTIITGVPAGPPAVVDIGESQYGLEVAVLAPAGEAAIYQGQGFYRLRFEITAANNMSTAVFVHQRVTKPSPTGTGDTHDKFIGVAGPLDMVQLSSDAPNADGFIRLPVADMLINSITLTDQTVAAIQTSLQALVDALKRLDNLEAQSTLTFTS